MPLLAGSVVLNSAGVPTTHTGLAAELYDSAIGLAVAAYAGFGQVIPATSAGTKIRQPLADKANADAAKIVAYLTANTLVSITVPINAFGAGTPAAPTLVTGTVS